MYNYDISMKERRDRYLSGKGITIGTDILGKTIKIPEEDLAGHLLITGKTGTGKSNLISNICGELSNIEGNIILIDPHGTLSDSVIQSSRNKELVFISPRSVMKDGSDLAISFNAIGMDRNDELSIEATTGWIRDMFATESVFSQGTWGPRLELVFKTLLKEMIVTRKNANLSDFVNILIDQGEMKTFLSQMRNQEARKFIQMQMKDWRGWIEYSASSVNKILPVLSSTLLKRLISGRADSFNLQEELRNRDRLLVVEISKGLLSEDVSKMVSVLFLLKVWNAIIADFSQTRKETPTYIIIDESQNIPSEILQRMLSEGRKYGIRIVLSVQFIDQTDKKHVNSIFGNIRNFISFNVSDSDARMLSSTIASGNYQNRVVSTLKMQKLHKALLWSQTNDGINGPTTVTPSYSRTEIDYERLEALKMGSICRFGAKVEPEIQYLQETPDRHEEIVQQFRTYLLKKNIEMRTGIRIGDTVPDGTFLHDGSEVIVEIEISDIEHKYRILNKIRNYGSHKIIFITEEHKSAKLYEMLIQPNNFIEKNSLLLEIPAHEQDTNIYMRDLTSHLTRIFILEASGGTFKLFDGSKAKRFTLSDLGKGSSFVRSIEKLETFQFRSYLYDIMIQSGIFYLDKRKIEGISLFGDGIRDQLFKEMGLVNREYITLKDLFTRAKSG